MERESEKFLKDEAMVSPCKYRTSNPRVHSDFDRSCNGCKRFYDAYKMMLFYHDQINVNNQRRRVGLAEEGKAHLGVGFHEDNNWSITYFRVMAK